MSCFIENQDPNILLSKALKNSAELLGLNQNDIAAMLKISPSALSKSLNRGIDPEKLQGRYALLIIKVYRSLNQLLGGNKEQMAKWIRAKLKPFSKSPLEMMSSEIEIVYLNDYLDSMKAKI